MIGLLNQTGKVACAYNHRNTGHFHPSTISIKCIDLSQQTTSNLMLLTSPLSAILKQSLITQALCDTLRNISNTNVHIPCAHFDRNF